MKRLFSLLFALLTLSAGLAHAQGNTELNPLPTPASNQIMYRTSDHQKITLNNANKFVVAYNDANSTYNTQDDYGIVSFDGNITAIGNYAFTNCTTLTAVVWPSAVTSIGDYAFQICTNLSSIDLQEGLKSIGAYAFNGCAGMAELTIPSTVTSIGSYAFNGWKDLTKLTVKAGSIGDYAFNGCTNLNSINIQEGVTDIGSYAFRGCSGLTSITISSSVTSIKAGVFDGCSGLTSITIPSSVTSIGGFTFYNCTGLKSITIPSSVTSIGMSAFQGCDGLASLVVLPATPPSVGADAFQGVSPGIPVYVYDVTEYEKGPWGAFTNFKGLEDYQNAAIPEIDAAMKDVELTDAEKVTLSVYKDQINSASDFADVDAAKEAALAFIKLHPTRVAALAEIQKEMDGETGSAYLNGLITEYVNAINAATNESTISSNKESAISKIESVITTYKTIKTEGKSAALGEMGEEKTNCPAVKVMKGDKVVILYAPDKVEMIKVSENK